MGWGRIILQGEPKHQNKEQGLEEYFWNPGFDQIGKMINILMGSGI